MIMSVSSTLSLFRKLGINSLYRSDVRSISRYVSPTLRIIKFRQKRLDPPSEQPRSSHLEWNYEAELFAFGKRLREEFDRQLLKKALVQKEYANLQEFKAKEKGITLPDKMDSNYELIQEGEKIISNYIKSECSKVYPEEIVNAIHNYLTSESMLAHIGKHIGLKDIILTNEFPIADKTLSDTFKAIIAALKQSSNLNKSEIFIKDFVLTQLNGKDVYEIWDPKEPYQLLNKILSERGIKNIEPRLCNQSSPNNILACFQVGLYSDKKLLGIGWGESIDIAKETAALDAIQKIYKNFVPTK